jgi:adenylate cyclase
MERRLAAILFADVVGYSKLSDLDEEGTRTRFLADLKEIIESTITVRRRPTGCLPAVIYAVI